jgi:hypothetical protein
MLGSSSSEEDLERAQLQVAAAGKRFAERMHAAGITPDKVTLWAEKQRWSFLRPRKRRMPTYERRTWWLVTTSSGPGVEYFHPGIYVEPDGSVIYENERGERKPYDGRGLPAERIIDLLARCLERHGVDSRINDDP